MSSFSPIAGHDLSGAPADPVATSRASTVMRVAVGLAGIVALAGASILTQRGALVAPVGMLVASAIASRRKRPLTRRASWLGAVVGVGVAIAVVVGLVFVTLPAGSAGKIKRVMDSTSVANSKAPPPAWLERMAPEAAARSRAQQQMLNPTVNRALALWTTVMGGTFVWAILSILIGTLGWGAGLLLAFAFTGRWISGGGPIALSA
jgi:hypothetical protein